MRLAPQSVADFYRDYMALLQAAGTPVKIWPVPREMEDTLRFTEDTQHRSYDRDAVHRCWTALSEASRVLQQFRSRFIGKCSPVHFFWGGFDLAVTRFSGRRAPERPGADAVTRESYSHEVISHGFWPGSGAVTEPSFYGYAVPEPTGFKTAAVKPGATFYSTDFNEFILPYEAVRTSRSPDDDLTAFLATTYDAAATLGGWNRGELERKELPV
jgi:hypothetical protein